MVQRYRSLLMGLVLCLGLVWIWSNRIPAQVNAEAVALPPAPAVGHPAPALDLPTSAGGSFRLADLVGKPVVLNFWATWCPHCRTELPELEAASRRLQDEIVVAGVNQGEDPVSVNAFAHQYGLSFVIPLDTRAYASRDFSVRSLPTTFFIDRTGVIRRIVVGAMTEATLSQGLKSIYP